MLKLIKNIKKKGNAPMILNKPHDDQLFHQLINFHNTIL